MCLGIYVKLLFNKNKWSSFVFILNTFEWSDFSWFVSIAKDNQLLDF